MNTILKTKVIFDNKFKIDKNLDYSKTVDLKIKVFPGNSLYDHLRDWLKHVYKSKEENWQKITKYNYYNWLALLKTVENLDNRRFKKCIEGDEIDDWSVEMEQDLESLYDEKVPIKFKVKK